MSKETFMQTKCFETTAEAKGEGLDSVKLVDHPPSPLSPSLHPLHTNNLLLTVPRRHFCCGSSMLQVVMFACIWSVAIWSPVYTCITAAHYAFSLVLFCNLK